MTQRPNSGARILELLVRRVPLYSAMHRGGRFAHTKIMEIPRKLAFAAYPDLTVRVLGGYSLLVRAE